MKHYLPIFLLSILYFSACRKDNPKDSSHSWPDLHDQTGTAINIDSLPLTVGHIWKYVSNGKDTTVISVTADTFINGISTIAVSQTSDSSTSIGYFLKKDSAYYLVAYRNPPDNNLIILNSMLPSLPMPLTLHRSWNTNCFNYYNYYHIDTSYAFSWYFEGYFITSLSILGNTNCARLMINEGDSGGVTTYQYYNEKGLVKEVQIAMYSTASGQGPSFYIFNIMELVYTNF